MLNILPEISVIKEKISNFYCESQELQTILRDFLTRESKLIRSIIALLFLKTTNESIKDEHYRIIVATELIHNASLIHDDAIDDSNIRRGEKSINTMFGNKLSIIAGDYLTSLAVQKLLTLNNSDILQIYFKTISKMCEGESLQYFQKGKIPTLDEYLIKTQYKTAELFKACLMANSIYSTNQYQIEAQEFAINYGIAFQIKNDLDDYKLGIDKSSDIQQGIYTAPVIFANSIENSDTAIEKTMDLIDNYCQRAKNVLLKFSDNEYSRSLMGLVNKLCN